MFKCLFRIAMYISFKINHSISSTLLSYLHPPLHCATFITYFQVNPVPGKQHASISDFIHFNIFVFFSLDLMQLSHCQHSVITTMLFSHFSSGCVVFCALTLISLHPLTRRKRRRMMMRKWSYLWNLIHCQTLPHWMKMMSLRMRMNCCCQNQNPMNLNCCQNLKMNLLHLTCVKIIE